MLKFRSFLDGYHDVESQLFDYLKRKAELTIASHDCKKRSFRTEEEVKAYRAEVREHFFKSLGGLPTTEADLNAEVVGVIQEETYKIEKVIFQSLPGFYVTANLYLPKTKEPVPGILLACGHSREGKAAGAYQKVCLDLVANGFAVLAVDPLGQGERFQYWRDGKEDVPWGTMEHTYTGLKCSLLGMSVARYFCWDLIRGLDYLSQRPEVDEERLGITGNSGGGTQTSYMMLLDERLKAAVPCCYISAREAYMGSGQAHDMEQNIFGAISHSPSHDDFLIAFAPKPVMVGAVESDFFNVEGAVRTIERARRIYSIFGAEENVQITIAPGTHGYGPGLRQAAVNWFRQHLLGLEPDFVTEDPVSYDPKELNCTKHGQILDDYPDATTTHDLLVAALPQKQEDFSLTLLEEVLAHPKLEGPKYPRVIAKNTIVDGVTGEKIFFWSEQGILVSGLLFKPDQATEDPVLLLLEKGTDETEASWELIASLLKEQRTVFVFDPRGIGAVKSRHINRHVGRAYHFYETEYRLSCDAQMLGSSLVGMQVRDALRGIEYLLERTGQEKVVLAGRGKGALLAAFAAPLAPTSQLRLSPLPDDFRKIIEARLYRMERVPLLFGPLNKWDLPDLYQYLKVREIEIYQQLIAPLGPKL